MSGFAVKLGLDLCKKGPSSKLLLSLFCTRSATNLRLLLFFHVPPPTRTASSDQGSYAAHFYPPQHPP